MRLTQFSILVNDWGNGYKFEVHFCFVGDHATVYVSDCVQNAKFGYCAEYAHQNVR